MLIDDNLVVTAELEGLRTLARLNRPKVGVVQEDVPGASCIWKHRPSADPRDLVRLRPGSGVPLVETLRAIRSSHRRRPGGHLEIRGAAGSLATEADYLSHLGGREVLALPRALMARRVSTHDAEADAIPGSSVRVAEDAKSLAELRAVAGEAFADEKSDEGAQPDIEADFFHAPSAMTYLAVHRPDGRVISTGSILIVNGVANVWSVATSPSERGQGAATVIMRAICAEAATRGAAVAALRTTDQLARPGGLYRNVGFELLGHEHIWELDNIDNLSLA